MAFYHVGNCDCPPGCCDCGTESKLTWEEKLKLEKKNKVYGIFYNPVTNRLFTDSRVFRYLRSKTVIFLDCERLNDTDITEAELQHLDRLRNTHNKLTRRRLA